MVTPRAMIDRSQVEDLCREFGLSKLILLEDPDHSVVGYAPFAEMIFDAERLAMVQARLELILGGKRFELVALPALRVRYTPDELDDANVLIDLT